MYGKHFQSTYNGSMVGAGPTVFAVWGYVISHTRDSIVELNPVILGAILGCPASEVEHAINKLCEPDEKSRSPDHDGRRLIKKTEFSYFVPTYQKYQSIRNEVERREYMKNYMRDYRKKQQDIDVNVNVNHGKPRLAHSYKDVDVDLDVDSDTDIPNKTDTSARSRFVKPTIEEIQTYCQERRNYVDPQTFIDYYTSNGWKVGRNQMKDWKAAIRTWEKNTNKAKGGRKTFEDYQSNLEAKINAAKPIRGHAKRVD